MEDSKNYNEVEVLLVEDRLTDAELTIRALRKQNFENKIHWVKDGVEALAFISCTGEYSNHSMNIPPKVVLLDLQLPRVSGIEVLTEMKKNSRTQSIPVVIMTSSQEDKDLIACYKLGANSFIVKPIEFEQFMRVLSSVGIYWLAVNKPPVA